MKITKEKRIEWTKRSIFYLLGLFFIAFGISIAIKSNLGVSPASSLPYVLSRKFTRLTLGTWTTIIYCVLVLIQLILLRKDFNGTTCFSSSFRRCSGSSWTARHGLRSFAYPTFPITCSGFYIRLSVWS